MSTDARKSEYLKGKREANLCVGDHVEVLCFAKSGQKGWGSSWVDVMNYLIGEVGVVIANDDMNTSHPYLEIKGNRLNFPYFVLAKVGNL